MVKFFVGLSKGLKKSSLQIHIESDIIGESLREILNNSILSQQDDRHRGTGLFCLVQEPQHRCKNQNDQKSLCDIFLPHHLGY